MKFVIRDDDLNYFSTAQDIERWYADIFAQKIPVGFSAIPFVKPLGDAYPILMPQEDREYPISANAELTAYVKGNPLIEILQHGTTHETKDGAFEYARPVPSSETLRGKAELEKAFDTVVSVFVPPHDWINRSGTLVVEAARMNIIRGRGAGLKNVILRPRSVANFFRMLAFKLAYALSGSVPAYPYVLDFGLHREACSYRLEDEDIFEGLEYAKRRDGIFVVAAHLHFLDEKKKERLTRVIARAKELDAEFVRPSDIFI